jgi:hypothetical protein
MLDMALMMMMMGFFSLKYNKKYPQIVSNINTYGHSPEVFSVAKLLKIIGVFLTFFLSDSQPAERLEYRITS